MPEVKNKIEIREDIKKLKQSLRLKTENQKCMEQKIDILWMDIKPSFCSLLREKNMYDSMNLIFNKGTIELKQEILVELLDNFLNISIHKHSKNFLLVLAKFNKKFLNDISVKAISVCRDLVNSKNGVIVLDKLYKLISRKKRGDLINQILHDSQQKDKLIQKLSSKRLWSYEIVHHILYDYMLKNKYNIELIIDLLQKNKQFSSVLKTYKGLSIGIDLLVSKKPNDLFLLTKDKLIEIVNNEYGVVFILKLLETEDICILKNITNFYCTNYKKIFVEECSSLPILYILNQKAKYFPTLFNQLRTKDSINFETKYFEETFTNIVSKHLETFASSFTYLIVYLLLISDKKFKKDFRDLILNSEKVKESENGSKLIKKMKKLN